MCGGEGLAQPHGADSAGAACGGAITASCFFFFLSGGFSFKFLTPVREFEFDFFFFSQLLCHINILYYFNKTVSLVSIFHPLLNNKDHFDIRMKG